MKTLLIDDVRDIKCDVIARTYEEGINALETMGPFDILYLDHDLGGEFYLDERGYPNTGYGVMRFLEEHPQYKPGAIKLVTSNPVGRQNMQVVINRLYREGSA